MRDIRTYVHVLILTIMYIAGALAALLVSLLVSTFCGVYGKYIHHFVYITPLPATCVQGVFTSGTVCVPVIGYVCRMPVGERECQAMS